MRYLVLLFCAQLASALTIQIDLTMNVSGEYIEIDQEQQLAAGWEVREDSWGDPIYGISKEIKTTDLPFKMRLADGYFSISKKGKVEMGISVGDADASAESSLTLPRQDGEFIKVEGIEFSTSGGDHASGSWGFDATAKISVK